MRRAGVLAAGLLLTVLTSCQGSMLVDGELKLDMHSKGHYPRSYKPVSIEKTEDVIPFKAHLPEFIPYKYEKPKIVITDWGKKKKLQLETEYTRKDQKTEKGFIALKIFNHKNLVSELIKNKKYEDTLELEDGTEAYFAYFGNYAELFWLADEEEYDLRHMFANEYSEKQVKKELLRIANSMN
ncbi:hypothetical protein [Fictibacillus sp. KU28468]|uniref:hypothetical protein n=1 Tax=Fictibacillus sp. KU28468 TaxID=2991053 RepID=UPI00223E72E1|nr:hypothetical protein [Fictibacillus sp. KU28468]UZJ78669.1 hypothetical protein OKX00_21555 [Fictibacillus sp. KU28468]